MLHWLGKLFKRQLLLVAIVLAACPSFAQAVTVVVDPGHGGSDPGAVGVNGLYEKTVNRDVALKLKAELERMGYRVLLTSDTDRTMSLSERVRFKEENGADIFVSVHANFYPNADVKGSMVLYYDRDYPQEDYPASAEMAALTPLSKQLALLVAESMSNKAGTVNLGIVPSAVYVARYGTMPSILVETAFLSNPADAANLADEAFRARLASGIAEGIYRFLPPNGFSDIGGHWAKDAIVRLKEAGIVEGSGDAFSPDRPLTRAEFLTMADRLFHFGGGGNPTGDGHGPAESGGGAVTDDVYGGAPAASPSGGRPEPGDSWSFADLDETHWAYERVMAAVRARIVTGYPDGTVRPDAPITRAEVAALFDRLRSNGAHSAALSSSIPQPFADVPADEWYTGSVYRLAQAGLMNGTDGRRFEPERPMSRAEAAVLFDRYLRLEVADAE
jgi:N-acetylmuramoyl-L-alanine amidase